MGCTQEFDAEDKLPCALPVAVGSVHTLWARSAGCTWAAVQAAVCSKWPALEGMCTCLGGGRTAMDDDVIG